MWRDPIVEEVRAIRDAYAKELGYDLQAIHRDLKKLQEETGRHAVSFPPKRPKVAKPISS